MNWYYYFLHIFIVTTRIYACLIRGEGDRTSRWFANGHLIWWLPRSQLWKHGSYLEAYGVLENYWAQKQQTGGDGSHNHLRGFAGALYQGVKLASRGLSWKFQHPAIFWVEAQCYWAWCIFVHQWLVNTCYFLHLILSRVAFLAMWPPYEGRDGPRLKGAGVTIFLQDRQMN